MVCAAKESNPTAQKSKPSRFSAILYAGSWAKKKVYENRWQIAAAVVFAGGAFALGRFTAPARVAPAAQNDLYTQLTDVFRDERAARFICTTSTGMRANGTYPVRYFIGEANSGNTVSVSPPICFIRHYGEGFIIREQIFSTVLL